MKITGILLGLFLLCAPLSAQVLVSSVPVSKTPAVYPELKKHLAKLIEIKTAQPEGNEIDAARYIYGVLDDENIDWTIYEPKPGRASIAAFLRAKIKPSKKPILLLSHLDTVNADSATWKTPPFTAVEKDGYMIGRGASDCKDLTAINLMTMVLLKRSGAVLDRDVIMLATADEEAGSGSGLAELVQNKWGDFNPGFALNEGGGVVLNEKGAPALVFVESAEKMYLDLKLTALGTGGHPSIPYASNAIYSLAGALAALEKRKMPIHVTPAAEKFFRSVYGLQNEDGRTTFDMFFSTDAKKSALASEAIAEDPFFNSQLRDTAVPTVVRAGQDNNVVPSEAWAVLNCRLLYDTDVDAFIEQIRTVAAAHGVKTTVLERPRQPFPQAMPLDDELYAAIARVSARLMPGAVVAAGMIPATTDSEFLRRAGVIAYGLGSPKTYGEMYDAHSPDEKIRLDSFYSYFDLTYNIVRSLAVPRQ